MEPPGGPLNVRERHPLSVRYIEAAMTDTISAPPGAAAPPPPLPRTLGRLALPPRGNRAAALYAWVGAAFYVAASATLFRALLARNEGSRSAAVLELLGLGGEPNFALTGMILLGFLLVLAAGWSVRQDGAEMAHEEEDVEWVNLHGREGLGLVFAPAARRESLFRSGEREYTAEAGGRVETLVADRVRRVLEKARDPYRRVSPYELRGIAEMRTAQYGVFARYASSLLLLLAVLGTFAGVKTALPGLIDAVSQTGGAQPGGADIAAPLRAVADAFGGNALALVGAIAVGLMAQGLATGRRNLLERLELVSTEFLHGGPSDDRLTEAVRDTGRAIEGLESGMNGLSDSFHEAFERLNSHLVELTAHREEALHQKLHEALGSPSGYQAGAERTAAGLTGVDERGAASWAQATESVNNRLSAAAEALREAAARVHGTTYARDERDPEVSALLRRIAGALERESGPTRVQLALSQAAGTLAALGVGYGLYLTGRALLPLLGSGS